jgi:uncharacterized RDD family membrane protein YckC
MSEEPAVNPVPVEARAYQGHRAGVVSRTLAGSIDFFVVALLVVGTYLGWAALLFLLNPPGFSLPSTNFVALLLVGGGILFIYLLAFWATTGRTYGDHVFGLRVVNFRGERMRPAGAALRSAFCVVFPIGLFWCAISSRNRSVQDVVLRTSVIYDWHPGQSVKVKE